MYELHDHTIVVAMSCASPTFHAGISCTEGSVRLVDDIGRISVYTEGRVEYCNNGVWGTVCHFGWDSLDATVVCRQLGLNTFGGCI